MLQFNTGKFWQDENLKKVICEMSEKIPLCTNYKFIPNQKVIISTQAGKLSSKAHEIEYSLKQKYLAIQGLASPSFEEYTDDFLACLTFFTGALFVREKELFDRLISSTNSLNILTPASELISPYFDSEVNIPTERWHEFQIFIENLLNLPRKKYLAVIKAIRSFVTAIYRIKDDLTLAYTLFVASAESLVKEFSDYEADWNDINPDKKRKFEKEFEILSNAGHSESVAKIKNFLIEGEHLKITYRYREFLFNHLPDEWFSLGNSYNEIGKEDMKRAIANSYNLRSGYVHKLTELPNNLDDSFYAKNILIFIQNEPYFTIRGMVKIIREVVLQFVKRSEKTPNEKIDNISPEMLVIKQVRWHHTYWFYNPTKLTQDTINEFLEVALNLLLNYYLTNTQLRFPEKILQKIEEIFPHIKHIKKEKKNKFSAFYLLYAFRFNPADREKYFNQNILENFCEHLNKNLSIEALALHFLCNVNPSHYFIEAIDTILEDYLKYRRYKKNNILLHDIIQAGIIADFVEKCRIEGNYSLANKWLKIGKENFFNDFFDKSCLWPTCKARLKNNQPIHGFFILFPKIECISHTS